jgi:hypothetical protein
MLESGSSGSVRGASSNGRPYREPRPFAALQGRPYERAGSARKRSSTEGVGCAICGPALDGEAAQHLFLSNRGVLSWRGGGPGPAKCA